MTEGAHAVIIHILEMQTADDSLRRQIVILPDELLDEAAILLGCTDKETEEVLHFLNQTDFQKTVLIRRGSTIPSWGLTDN